MRKSSSDILAGLGFLAIAIAFGVQYEGITGVSRVFPEILITFIGFGGIWFVGKGMWRRRSEGVKFADPQEDRTAWPRVAVITVFSLCYAVAIDTVGFFVSTGVFLFVAFFFLDTSNRSFGMKILHGVIFAIVFSLLIWGGFVNLLSVPAPEGFLF